MTAGIQGTGPRTMETTTASRRQAAYAEAAALLPTRYTSDPDVIDNPEETAKVQAAWTLYLRAMDAVLEKYPYTAEEKARMPTSTTPFDHAT